MNMWLYGSKSLRRKLKVSELNVARKNFVVDKYKKKTF